MKNIFNKFAFFIALSFVFISCGNLTTSENDDSIPQGKGKITISTDLQNGRSVLPTAIEETTTGLKWELVGKKNGEQKTIKTWTDDNSRTAYELMTDSEIVIDTGTWDFTLTASQNNATAAFNVLQAHCNSVQINAGNNTLNFVMQEATENAATGSIEFTLKFPKDVVDKVEAKLFKYENKDTEISTQTLNIDSSSTDNCSFVKYSYPDATGTTSSDLSAGYYILKIELQQNVGVTTEDFKKINTYSCLIRVAPGLLSQGKYTLTDLAQLYTINYECNQGSIGNQLTTTSYNAYTSFNLPTPTTEGYEFVGWYTDSELTNPVELDENDKYRIKQDTTLYAKWVESNTITSWGDLQTKIELANTSTVTEFVITEDLTATSTITVSKPFKITSDKNVTITRGNTTGNTSFTDAFFKVESAGNLELEGTENITITLDGGKANESPIFATAPLITSSGNLTLTNCILRNNKNESTSVKGGAINISGGSFTMNGGTISGCTAKENGNAVYIDSGNLTLSGDAEITSDVYIANENSVIVAGELTKEKVATITLPAYNVGTPVITAADSSINLADQVGKFTLKNENYKISDEGTVVSKSGGGGTVNPDVTVTSWSTLKSTIESIDTTYTEENPYVIEITSDITTSADTAAEITVSSHVKLVSNTNCIITRTSDFAGVNLFQVNTEASLTIGDANAGGTLTLDGGGTDVSATKSLVNVTGTLVLNEKSVLQNNNCPDSYATSGAAVFSNGGTLKVFGSTIKNNSNNHSSNFGGAIYIKNGTLNITSGTFEENKTNKNGGAIYVTEGTVNITGGNFINNKVSTGSNKTETSYGGGAIYIDSAETSISAATFESNITEDGVGTLLITNIGTETSPAMIYNCTFTNNKAYQNGAAIYTGGNSYIEINNCTFTDNTLSIDGSHDVYIGNTGGTTKINGSAMTGAWTSSSN